MNFSDNLSCLIQYVRSITYFAATIEALLAADPNTNAQNPFEEPIKRGNILIIIFLFFYSFFIFEYDSMFMAISNSER